MAESDRLREGVERAVLAALDAHIPALRDAIMAAVLQELGERPAEVRSASAALNAALAAMMERGTQAEILSAMLEGAARFGGRVALFVLRGTVAQGWQARGLPHDEGIKAYSLDANGGLARRAIDTRGPVSGNMAEFDARLAAGLGAPVLSDVIVLPLIVRNKVAALVYADSGQQPGGTLDAAAVELLARAGGSWIELAAVKKAQGVALERPAAGKAVAAAGPVSVPRATPVEVPTPEPISAIPAPASPPPIQAAAPPQAPPRLAPEEDETHRRAKRFAKLLVEEIKLYNEAKVGEGRQNGSLYELLRDDIEKSRASYEKRYGQTPAASADYFTQELIRILAGGNESLLGSNIPR